jgi:hypothetical protein
LLSVYLELEDEEEEEEEEEEGTFYDLRSRRRVRVKKVIACMDIIVRRRE